MSERASSLPALVHVHNPTQRGIVSVTLVEVCRKFQCRHACFAHMFSVSCGCNGYAFSLLLIKISAHLLLPIVCGSLCVDTCQESHARTSRKATQWPSELELTLIQKTCSAGILKNAGTSPFAKAKGGERKELTFIKWLLHSSLMLMIIKCELIYFSYTKTMR